MKNTKHSFIIVIISLLTACLINAPYFDEYRRFGNTSIFSFNDIDEPNYFRLLFSVARGEKPESFYWEHQEHLPLAENLISFPNRIVDYLIESCALYLGLSPIELNLILDLFCTSFALILLTELFLLFKIGISAAFVGALVTIFFPWTFSIGQYFQFQEPFRGTFAYPREVLNSQFYPRIPIFRSVYTQISLVMMLVFLKHLGKTCMRDNNRSIVKLFALGCLAGSSLYIYFFGWIASMGAGVVWIIASAASSGSLPPHQRFVTIVKESTAFLMGILAVATPGLIVLLHGPPRLNYTMEKLGQFWFFPLEYALGIIFLSLLLLLRKWSRPERIILVLMLGSFIGEILFNNLQTITQKNLEPFHLGKLYLQPFNSGLAVVFVLSFLRSALGVRAIILSVCLVVSLTLSTVWQFSTRLQSPDPLRTRMEELITWIHSSTASQSIFAVPQLVPNAHPWQISNLPCWILAMTNRRVLYQTTNWMNDLTANEMFEREHLNHWLTEGSEGLDLECGKTLSSPIDIFYGTRTAREMRRAIDCRNRTSNSESFLSEKLLSKYRADYVLWDEELEAGYPQHLQNIADLVWASSDEKFNVFQLRVLHPSNPIHY